MQRRSTSHCRDSDFYHASAWFSRKDTASRARSRHTIVRGGFPCVNEQHGLDGLDGSFDFCLQCFLSARCSTGPEFFMAQRIASRIYKYDASSKCRVRQKCGGDNPRLDSAPHMEAAYAGWAREKLKIRVDERVIIRRANTVLSSDVEGVVLGDDGSSTEVECGLFCSRVLNRRIEAGTELIAVPFSALLHVLSPLQAFSDGECRWVRLVAGTISRLKREDDMLALRLLYEARERKRASVWWEHLKRLPSEGPPHCLLRWKPEELNLIKGTSAYMVANKWKRQLAADFGEIEAAAKDASEDSTIPRWLTLENYEWAISIIWSRCISITKPNAGYATEFKVLAPFFDMANHGGRKGGRVTRHGFNVDKDAVILEALEPILPGQQVSICYSLDSSTRFLLLYGFADPDNDLADETVDVFAPLDPRVTAYDIKYKALDRWRHQADGVLPFKLSIDNPLPEELVASQRVARAKEGAELDNLDCALPPRNQRLSDSNERDVIEGLRDGIGSMRDTIPLDEDADNHVLGLEDVDPRSRYAAVVRRAERRVLQASLDHIDSRLNAF